MKNMIKRLCLTGLAATMLGTSLVAAGPVLQAKAAEAEVIKVDEKAPLSLQFLYYCDLEEQTQWDDRLGRLTEDEAREIKNFIETNIIKGTESDYEKAHLIFDWIYENVKYAHEYNMQPYINPYDIFIYRSAVCGGFSNLYKAMLNQVGIPCVLFAGDTIYGAHEWNAVYADGKWFFSDSTWGGVHFDPGYDNFLIEHTPHRLEQISLETSDGLLIGYDMGIAVVGVTNAGSTVNVPESFKGLPVTSVSYQLFASYYGVKELNLGKNVTTIDTQSSSSVLEVINVSADNSSFYAKDGVLYTKDKKEILIYPGGKKDDTYTLPKETTVFDLKETLGSSYLKNILVEEGNSAYSSYDGALYNADQSQLVLVPGGKTEVHIPADATIGDVAFANVDRANFTIVGTKNSPAHIYATQNQIAFREYTEQPVVTPTETEAPKPTETEAPKPTETQAPTPTEDPGEIKWVTDVFTDVYNDWYIGYVQYVYENDLMTGIKGTTRFEPNANITKAQVAQVLYNMEGQPSMKNLSVFSALNDVYINEWYGKAVAWAYSTGVVTGDTNAKKFFPNADVTREQLALMMYRYAMYKKMDVSATSNLDGLKNAENVNNWAADGVKWAVGSGLISGIEKDGVKDLAPQGNASRAQVAAILQRFCK